jgi:alkylation response protein AidB-like acyl-CoA dehydrogenase
LIAIEQSNPEHGIDDGTVPESAVGTDALLEALRPMNGGWQNELAAVHDAALAWAMTPPVAGAPPPIDDPQVRRRLAQVALDAELVAVTPNPYARVIASDLLVRDAADLLDMTGAAGMLEWGEAGSSAGGYLEWAHRFAQGTSIYGGTTDIQRNLIAEQFLGLPRHAGPVRG